MKIYSRDLKKTIDEVDTNAKSVKFLYNNIFGRLLLKVLTRPFISKLNGIRYSSKRSARLISKFVSKNEIDMSVYPEKEYISFNDFFTREILKEKRPISSKNDDLISPCDALLTVYKISEDLTFNLKNSVYTVSELLKDDDLSRKYNNGYLLLFRLTVRDYHRYCFIDNGNREEYKRINGVLHTVNPIACKKVKVYSENSREYTTLHLDNFGDVIQVEVGALMVGKIRNNNLTTFRRGDEKGYFEFGASTIILLFEQNKIKIDDDILAQSENEIETRVKYGEKIGKGLKD